tara:strand:+ start:334 stop:744 length:411 start_codon:yes stop_codon:yes gene_type:complete
MKKAIICDLDKTLALFKRDPFKTEDCLSDIVNVPIKNIVNFFNNNNYDIIIVSGRHEKFKDITLKWLKVNKINYTEIFLRENKDYRSDDIVKKEIYLNKIKNAWVVEFVLDDRDKVVKMWRNELNLTCLQVNYGDF